VTSHLYTDTVDQRVIFKMNNRKIILLLTGILLLPTVARADGGAPLLLFFNSYAFLFGSVFIILIEWLIYLKIGAFPRQPAFWASLTVNIASTLLIGIVLPLILALITGLTADLSGHGSLLATVGTWIAENNKYNGIVQYVTITWLLISFVLTVYFEARLLSRFCTERNISPRIELIKLSWYANGITYAILLLVFIGAFIFELY